MSYSGVLTATVLLCFFATLLMGVYAKLPYVVAPGMGINAFFTYTIILGKNIPWQTALGMVFLSGVLFLLLSLTPAREKLVHAIPKNLRLAIAVGIGGLLSFIGMKNGGVVTDNPATFVQWGGVNFSTIHVLLGVLSVAYLSHSKKAWGYLLVIALITLSFVLFEKVEMPDTYFSSPDFHSVFLQMNIVDALSLSLLPAILSLMFTDLFDSVSTFIGVSQACHLVDEEGEPKNLRKGLLVDAFATLVGGPLGTSSGTAYVESAAGIEAGGRTGWTAVFASFCFLPFLFIAPLAQVIPSAATAPILIFVGFLMFRSVSQLQLTEIEEALPAFAVILLIPLTFSITQGILWGILSYTGLCLLLGKKEKLNGTLLLVSIVCLFLVFIG